VLDVPLPDPAGSIVARAFHACLTSVLEAEPQEVPTPEGDLRDAIGRWRTWLAGRGLGLVPIARAEHFQWPGYWIALLDDSSHAADADLAVLMFGTPPGVVLSPQNSALLGRAAKELPVREGFVVAAFDPTWTVSGVPAARTGTVTLLAIADGAEQPMRTISTAQAIPGRGLDGDRYAAGTGTFGPRSGRRSGYDLTLIEAEALDELTLPDGMPLSYADARRNVVTRGIDLNDLVGQRFRIGPDVECIGRRLCEPCAHLERLTRRGVLRGLIHRGGLRADIVTGGTISHGDAIEPLGLKGAGEPR
jgi:MOSC domain